MNIRKHLILLGGIMLFMAPVSCSTQPADDADKLNHERDVQLSGGEYFDVLPPLYGGRTFAYDQDGILWMTKGMTAYYDGRYQVFDRYNTDIPDSQVAIVFVDSNNIKWFGTEKGYVYTFDGANWEVKPTAAGEYRWEAGELEGSYRINGIHEDSNGNIWVSAHYGGIWSYKDGQMDKQFVEEFRDNRVYSMTTDNDGNVFILAGNRLYRYNGETLDDINDDLHLDEKGYPITLYFDTVNDTLYIGTNRGLIWQSGNDSGILTMENSNLPENEICFIDDDRAGTIWVATGMAHTPTVGILEGDNWTAAHGINKNHLSDIIYSKNEEQWYFFCFNRVYTYKGMKLTPLEVMRTDPREWWREQSIHKLVEEESVLVDIHEVLQNPLAYKGKKICFTGKITSSFESTSIIDQDGKRLSIWPEAARGLPEITMHDLPGDGYETGSESDYLKLSGYLEFQGYYGHMGGWDFQFYIVEAVPLP